MFPFLTHLIGIREEIDQLLIKKEKLFMLLFYHSQVPTREYLLCFLRLTK